MKYTFMVSSTDRFLFIFILAMPVVVIRQRKAWRRRDGVFLYFEVCHRIISQLVLFLNPFPQGQCWRNCQPQGRNERFRHHWPRSKRMCAFISLHTHLSLRTSDPSLSSSTNRQIYGLVLHQMLALSCKPEF